MQPLVYEGVVQQSIGGRLPIVVNELSHAMLGVFCLPLLRTNFTSSLPILISTVYVLLEYFHEKLTFPTSLTRVYHLFGCILIFCRSLILEVVFILLLLLLREVSLVTFWPSAWSWNLFWIAMAGREIISLHLSFL